MFNSLRLSASLFKVSTATGRGLNIYRTFYNSNPLRFSSNTVSNTVQKSLLEPRNAFRTAISRYCSEANKNPQKTKKIVGYWLLGSSGMVFVAVVLGGVSLYLGVMYCILTVVKEIIKITIR